MSTTTEIRLNYGALSAPIEEQLNKQGFTLGEKAVFFDKLHHSLTMCMFHLLTETQYTACLKKFNKMVIKNVELLQEGEGVDRSNEKHT